MSMQTTTKKAPLLNNLLKMFMVAMVLANIAGNMYGPLMPLYLKELDANVVQVGLFFTLSQILPLVLQIIGGWLSDNLGRLRSIAMGSLAGVFSYVAMILSPTWQWLLLGEGLGAITRSLVAPSFGAFIAEQSSEENRARVYGISDVVFNVVTIVGPPLGGWLVDQYGFRIMLMAAGALYSIATVLRVIMARMAGKTQTPKVQNLTLSGFKANIAGMLALMLGGGLITWMIITDGTRDIGYSMSFTLIPLYMQEFGGISMQQVGWLSSISGVAMMISTMPGGWLADKKGERVSIALGFLINFVAFMVFLNVNNFWGYASAWALFGLGWGMMSPAYNSLTSKAIPEHLRGTGFGLLQTSLGLFSLPAPAIGAQLWDRFSPRFPFQLTAGLALISILPIWFKFKLPPTPDKPAPEAVEPGTAD